MQKAPFVFPIIGGRKVEHLHANVEALEISLSPEQIAYLESIVPFDPGFPSNFIVSLAFAIDTIQLMAPFAFYRAMDQIISWGINLLGGSKGGPLLNLSNRCQRIRSSGLS